MPRRRKDSKLQRREKNKELKRQARRKAKDDSDLLTGNDRKRAENGLNFPKKAENGLNFPKKSENGLNFPKKSENELNFPKKSEIAEDDMPVPAKHFIDSVTETYTESSLNFAKCFPNECLNVCSDFDETFADAYPNDEEVIIQNTDIEIIGTGPKIEVTSYNSPCTESLFKNMDTDKPLLTQPSPLLWNANQIMFGSFHQNDKKIS